MSWSNHSAELLEVLSPLHGKREAENIIRYFFDARRNITFTEKQFEQDLEKLRIGLPIQQIVNTSYFYGLTFYVNEHVLIPRPETEELVHLIISDYKKVEAPLSILDIGTGSGCILLSLLHKLEHAIGYGIDMSSEALEVFRKNAEMLNISCQSVQANILKDSLNDLPLVDIIVSNPPYILEEEIGLMSQSTLDYEPRMALFVDGDDPLQFYMRIIELAHRRLKPKGKLYFETSHLHHALFQSLLKTLGLKHEFCKDLQDNFRMLKIHF